MPSANGWKLCVPCTAAYCSHRDGIHEVVASWPAPFFVLVTDDDMAPLLIHCENEAEARSRITVTSCGTLLDADFQRIA